MKGYSGIDYWEDYHSIGLKRVRDRELKQKKWLHSFVPTLRQHEVETILDLGCGSGHDALVLADLGMRVSGNDISHVAIDHARQQAIRAGHDIDYQQHDIALTMPYEDGTFDAVICNLTLHMFPAAVATDIVSEVYRCLCSGGLFLFHVNSTEDLPYRSMLQPPVSPLGEGMYRFGKGQTMRFYNEADCRGLLRDWSILCLQAVQKLRPDGQVQKCAWRCVAQKPG